MSVSVLRKREVQECVCVCVSLAGGEFLTGQSTAFLLGGDVMRTSSPLADRQPCLCSSLEEKPHCVSEYMCVCERESMNVCASLSDCVIGSWGWWGSREALERVYFPPHRLERREPLTDAFL